MNGTPVPHPDPPCTGCTRRSVLVGTGVVVAASVVAGCASGNAESEPLRVPLTEIPVGSARVYSPQRVVITQPNPGDVRAFSAICPHQGCTVSKIGDGTIECACHGSIFSITDGSVLRGPARTPLTSRTVTIEANQIIIE